jgi:hypothetical protein
MMDNRKIELKLASIFTYKSAATEIHKLYLEDYYIGIGLSKELHIFKEQNRQVFYLTTIELPMDIPKGTRAAFPIEELSDCCCVITPECLESSSGFVDILHEMVHCFQCRTCEDELKSTLKIHKRAVESGDYMWEINHAFPYGDSDFNRLVQNISAWDYDSVVGSLSVLSAKLSVFDYEYMIWQIWKEGFARYVENLIRKRYEIAENTGGISSERLCRTSFYYIGDHIWRKLNREKEELIDRLSDAFYVIRGEYAV